MLELSAEELTQLTGGRLRFGTLPPLAGGMEPVRRVVVQPDDVRAGDVFWMVCRRQVWPLVSVQRAFIRGAVGVVVDVPGIEPWAGSFVLQVSNSPRALCRLVNYLAAQAVSPSELFAGAAARCGVSALIRSYPASDEDLTEQEIQEAFRAHPAL